MKSILVLAVLGAAGYFGYQKFTAKTPAVKVYERFADAMARNRYDMARELASGDAMGAVAALEGLGNRRVGPNIGFMPSAAQLMNEIAGSVASTSQRIEAQTKDPDGIVHLVAVSSVCRETPGCTGMTSRCNKCKDFQHQVDVCVDDAGRWTVCGFIQSE